MGLNEPLWRYLVSGFMTATLASVSYAALFYVVIVLPILLPYKMLAVYVFEPHPRHWDALLASIER
jgi:hypothetical protein